MESQSPPQQVSLLLPPAALVEPVNYRNKYKALKRKMRMLVCEQECFMEELRKSQRKLLKVTRDKSFLLDKLLQYEKTEDQSGDSDATAPSDSESEGAPEHTSSKKKKLNDVASASPSVAMAMGVLGYAQFTAPSPGVAPPQVSKKGADQLPAKKKPKLKKKLGGGPSPTGLSLEAQATIASLTKASPGKAGLLSGARSAALSAAMASMSQHGRQPGAMTLEEVERHLELKSSNKSQFMSIEKAPHSLPDDIFSHDNSNSDRFDI